MSTKNINITILGTSFEFASDHLIHELCTLGRNVSITIYDVNLTSEFGKTGNNLALQAQALYPKRDIKHTSDISIAVQCDVMLFWGLYFPRPKPYNAAYSEFFAGHFKTEVEKLMTEQGDYSPTVIFLQNNGCGLRAANLLGKEVPTLKPHVWVIGPINNTLEIQMYFRIESEPIEMEEIPATSRDTAELLLQVNGGIMDIDGIVTCIKGLFDNLSPRDMCQLVGMFPDQDDQEKWKIPGDVCIFMPKEEVLDAIEMKKILQEEISAVKKFLS